jgi:4-nitrophenyl phosphatase
VAAKIERVAGYHAEPSQVFSSAMAAGHLVRGAETAFVVGGPGVHQALTGVGVEVVSAGEPCDVVVVGLDVELSYQKLVDATLAVRRGARLVATNHDPTFPTPEGLYPGGGAIVAFLETATDTVAEVAGKPHAAMRETIAGAIGDGEVWMVGDRPDTDMAMATAAGWHGVLVRTGIPKGRTDEGMRIDVADLAEFASFLLQRS